MRFQDHYFIGVGDPMEGKSIETVVYIDPKGQVRVNINHCQETNWRAKPDPDRGIDMDLVTFYKLVSVLDEIKEGWFWGEEL